MVKDRFWMEVLHVMKEINVSEKMIQPIWSLRIGFFG